MRGVVVPKTVKRIRRGAFYGTKSIAVYDTIDPDAKPAKDYCDPLNGVANSEVGWLGIHQHPVYGLCAANAGLTDFEVTVKSAPTDETLYRVFMPLRYAKRKVYCTLASSWGRNASFAFNRLDELFAELPNKKAKLKTAINRITYPVDLSDSVRECYGKYLSKMAKDAILIISEDDDIDALKAIDYCGVIKKSNVDDLLEISPEAPKVHEYIEYVKTNRFHGVSKPKKINKSKSKSPRELVDMTIGALKSGGEGPLDEVLSKLSQLSGLAKRELLFAVVYSGNATAFERTLDRWSEFSEEETGLMLVVAIGTANEDFARRLIGKGACLARDGERYSTLTGSKNTVVLQTGGYWFVLLREPKLKIGTGHLECIEGWGLFGLEEMPPAANDDCIIALAKDGLLTPVDISTLFLLAADDSREKLACELFRLGAKPRIVVPFCSRHIGYGYTQIRWLDDIAVDKSLTPEQVRIIAEADLNILLEAVAAKKTVNYEPQTVKELTHYVHSNDVNNKKAWLTMLIDGGFSEEVAIAADWPGAITSRSIDDLIARAQASGNADMVALLLGKWDELRRAKKR